MTNILILGANGQLARNTTRMLLDKTDARLTLFVRSAGRLSNPAPDHVSIAEGNVLDGSALREAMKGQRATGADGLCAPHGVEFDRQQLFFAQ